MSNNELEWDDEAEKRLRKVPFFVRKLARRKIERAAREEGISLITVDLVERVKNREMGG